MHKELRNARLLLIDTETTGVADPPRSAVLQATCLTVEKGQIVHDFDELANPGMPIEKGAMDAHHITEEMVRDKPPVHEVIARLEALIKPADNLVIYNAPFDLRYFKVPADCTIIDPLRLFRKMLPEMANHKLTTIHGAMVMADLVKSDLAGKAAHDAGADTRMTLEVLTVAADLFAHEYERKRGREATIKDLVGYIEAPCKRAWYNGKFDGIQKGQWWVLSSDYHIDNAFRSKLHANDPATKAYLKSIQEHRRTMAQTDAGRAVLAMRGVDLRKAHEQAKLASSASRAELLGVELAHRREGMAFDFQKTAIGRALLDASVVVLKQKADAEAERIRLEAGSQIFEHGKYKGLALSDPKVPLEYLSDLRKGLSPDQIQTGKWRELNDEYLRRLGGVAAARNPVEAQQPQPIARAV